MRFISLVVGLLSVLPSFVNCAGPYYTDVTLFQPPASYKVPRTLYPRGIRLKYQSTGTLNVMLATWENYGPEPPYFPIMSSLDGGKTWNEVGRVHDTQWGAGLRYQPFLYELPQAFGGFPKGTILLSGSVLPEDLSFTQIELYASTDRGVTWKFVSHIARGGKGLPNNGETPVWEPFLMLWNNQMVVYYSDQRDPLHGQKMVHQVSSDLVNWGPVVDDIAYATYNDRPGMPVVAKLPNGKFIMTYEWYGAPEGGFVVYYRLSTDPLNFNNKAGFIVKATDGTKPTSSPYVVWTPAGGINGTVVVSANSHTELFVNTMLAEPGTPWRKVSVPSGTPKGYTRYLEILEDSKDLWILNGGVLNGSSNKVSGTRLDVTKL